MDDKVKGSAPYEELMRRTDDELIAAAERLRQDPLNTMFNAQLLSSMIDFKLLLEEDILSEEQTKALLELDDILGFIEQYWLDFESNYLKDVENCIVYVANELVEAKSKGESP